MTRLEAAAFVEALTVDQANVLREATRHYHAAFEQSLICAKSRMGYWTYQAAAARERLISALADEEPTQPLAGAAK